MTILKETDDILKSLHHIQPGLCPNFLISGKSLSVLENAGLKAVEQLARQNVMDFRGILKYFTLRMPYINTEKDQKQFSERLAENISIAQDCYDSFCGFVLIELAEECGTDIDYPFFNGLVEEIRKYPKIRFIFLLPTEKSIRAKELLTEFIGCGPCIHFHIEEPTISQRAWTFISHARKQGYQVPEETEQFLHRRLKEREESGAADNQNFMKNLANQIIFEKKYREDADDVIGVADIRAYLTDHHKQKKPGIGFICHQNEIS